MAACMKGWAASVTRASRRSGVLGILTPALAEKAPDQPPAALTTVAALISPADVQRLAILHQPDTEPLCCRAIGVEHGVVMDDGVAMHQRAGGLLAADEDGK